jgi:CheY-like chemotaxis protein
MEKNKILVLDDEKNITMLTRAALSMHGYLVTEFNDPVQALEAVKKQSFDLILADIMMPHMTGIEFIRRAKTADTCSKTRYMTLTAKKLTEEELREIYDLSAEVMFKPFIPQKLVEKVGEILR